MYETNLKQKIRNPLNIRKIESRIYVCDLNNSHNNLDLETTSKLPILTYGGLNTDILADLLSEEGYQVHQDELCPEDDEDIGLRMPDVWYLNKGAGALSIPMYYSFMQLKASVLDGTAFEENKEIVDTFGRVSLIEVYHEKKLFEKLDAEGVKYFSTPRTLTECTRVLEGWDITI